MPSREIPYERWQEFFVAFSRQHEGWRVHLDPGTGTPPPEQGLHQVSLRRSDGGEQVEVLLDDGAPRHVAGPRRVWLDETIGGAHEGLRIEVAGAPTVAIRFRVPAHHEEVDGLASDLELEAMRVRIPVAGGLVLDGELEMPPARQAVVAFVHGTGSIRQSARGRAIAETMRERGLGTLLVDLLSSETEQDLDEPASAIPFDVGVLGDRMIVVVDWLSAHPEAGRLPVGLFGASTGAAAALIAAAARPDRVYAVVSRGGRPDLADLALPRVRADCLFVVGGADPEVLRANQEALQQMSCTKRLEVIPNATHRFSEPGALDEVARLSASWFLDALSAARA